MEISQIGRRRVYFLSFTIVLSVVTILFVSNWGAFTVSLTDAFFGEKGSLAKEVFWNLRFPRVILATLLGGTLAWSGALAQGLFRNPIVDPGLVGITAGSAFFASVGIVLGTNIPDFPPVWGVIILSFIGGITTGFLVYLLARVHGKTEINTLLLTGIAINALCFAGIGILSYIANDAQLRNLSLWNMGSLGGASWTTLLRLGPILLIPLIASPFLAGPMNVFALGEREAMHLGISVEVLKSVLVLLIGVSVGACVSLSGNISFVGLAIPHIVRLIIGQDYKYLLYSSFFLGGALLTIGDGFCRTVIAPAEIPVGIITAFIGAPVFLFLLNQRKRRLA
ncbi:hemin ABC transporter permease (plasmid) [Leptospira kobayashii]|uniref:Hemin ABC transporter permease n=1 Tax=Leptospira kobayashii TaxID=1917830 RepID=A0ABN6KM14_9LEPT|nr:iron ABC transporter permease [Leptospira kobayashii]BDA80936.1 hemin ABC transporter permease [Leptospira kobayashii]